MEVVDSVLFSQLIMNFEAVWKKVFKRLELFRFPVERGHRCRERLWKFGNSVDIIMKLCRINVFCQLLKSQQNLIFFTYRGDIFTAELWLTRKVVLFLLS